MRNNEERIPKPVDSPMAMIQQPNTESKPFSFPTFTDFVELPSKGQFYDESNPLFKQEVTEVYYMSSTEEDILTSETLLEKGLMFDKLIGNVLKNKNILPENILDADRSAILISVRKNGLDNIYQTIVLCPKCSKQKEIEADLTKDIVVNENQVPIEQIENITQLGPALFQTTLQMQDVSVDIQFKLLDGSDESELFKKAKVAVQKKGHETNFSDKLKQIVVAVNGNTDRHYVNKFCEWLPYMFAKELLKIYRQITPSIKIKSHLECSCDYSGLVEVPVSKNFFWPDL